MTRHQRRILYSLLALSFCLIATARATEVPIFVVKDGVYIATDSRIYTPNSPPETRCKIRQTGSYFWAVAGATSHKGTSFNVDHFLSEGRSWQGHPGELLNSIAAKVVGPLEISLKKELPALRRWDPDYYRSFVAGGTPLQLCLVSAASDRIVVFRKSFKLVGTRVVPQETKCCKSIPCIVSIAPPDVQKYIETHEEVKNILERIDLLMRLGFAADPKRIAPPVNILYLSNGSARWIRQNGCPDIEPF